MAAVPVVINNAVIIDYYGRVIGGPYKIVGNLARTDVGIGGGPIFPEVPPDGGNGKPPIDPGLHPEHPIILPPIVPVPPDRPNIPPPGSPPVIVGGTQPIQPMVPPPAVIIDYPGIGKVIVPQPTVTGGPAPT